VIREVRITRSLVLLIFNKYALISTEMRTVMM